jgi:leucyl-tRNA synthetase
LGDFEKCQFNTVVAGCMSMLNALPNLEYASEPASEAVAAEGLLALLRLLSPIAPHITHYLWREVGAGDDIQLAGWPVFDAEALRQDSIEMAVQVNGKLRGRIRVPANSSEEFVKTEALRQENTVKFIDDKTVRKIIVVPEKLVNIVAN